MFTMLKKGTKYIPSKTKENIKTILISDESFLMPNINDIAYKPYIGCANKPTFAIEVLFSYRKSENFELEKCYDNITVYACCSSPKEAVDFAMDKWETVVRNKKIHLQNYALLFIRISDVYVKIKDDYWKSDSLNTEE